MTVAIPEPSPTLVHRRGASTGRSNRDHLMPGQVRELCRDLATGEQTKVQLARKYRISNPCITKFSKVHAREIDAIKANLDDEFAGLWIASKANRIQAYQEDLEASADGDYGTQYEQIRTRAQILRQVAEELGQLPSRGAAVSGEIKHVLKGVDLEALS
jgi:hypothetical protein